MEDRRIRAAMISTFFTHHQKPLSDALYRLLDGRYTFYCTESIPKERVELGYSEYYEETYIASAEGTERKTTPLPDVLISGIGRHPLISRCVAKRKLVFRYSERPVKEDDEGWKYIPRFIKWHFQNPPLARNYLLCASAYTMADYKRFRLFRNRGYKWGYFPETKRYGHIDTLLEARDTTKIIWCGRMLEWKHPDDALAMAKLLKESERKFHLEIIGAGELLEELKNTAHDSGLDDHVSFSGALSPDEVRRRMEKAGIFIFTSDRREGWGAVLNEAMNSGCAAVASDAAGSVPYLIEDGRNGYSYHSGNVNELASKVGMLLDSPEEQRRLGREAYSTIAELWNAEVASERLIKLAEAILDGNRSPDLFESGPCSRAR